MNTNNKKLVEFITKRYTDYVVQRNTELFRPEQAEIANKHDINVIQLFWEKIAEFPEYNERNYQAYLIQRSKGLNRGNFGNIDSSNPDVDYACRITGINSAWILSLQREFFYGKK